MPKYDEAGRPGCGDPDRIFMVMVLMIVVTFKMLFGKLPKTW